MPGTRAFVRPGVKIDFAALPLDRLIAKEVALGTIRDIPVDEGDHLGLATIAPFEEVGSDDVIFDYIEDGLSEGLAPARAQDAESELAQKDNAGLTTGRARIIDWSLKDSYESSHVMGYRDNLRVLQALQGMNSLQLQNGAAFETPVREFQSMIARDDAWRRQRLDDRLEHIIMTSFETSKYAYNDGKIKFAVDFKRPAGQQDQVVATPWNDPDADPIGDIRAMNRAMYDTYGVEFTEAWCSKYVLRDLFKLTRFVALTGLVVGGTPISSPIDMAYLRPDFNEQAAIDIIQRATGVTFHLYDATYRVRALGQPSSTAQNVRYMSSKKVVFRISDNDLRKVDVNGIGFAKTLTSPHAEGNFTPGYYEWEKERSDPWVTDRGNGIKAFPIFPFMKYSYVMTVLP